MYSTGGAENGNPIQAVERPRAPPPPHETGLDNQVFIMVWAMSPLGIKGHSHPRTGFGQHISSIHLARRPVPCKEGGREALSDDFATHHRSVAGCIPMFELGSAQHEQSCKAWFGLRLLEAKGYGTPQDEVPGRSLKNCKDRSKPCGFLRFPCIPSGSSFHVQARKKNRMVRWQDVYLRVTLDFSSSLA